MTEHPDQSQFEVIPRDAAELASRALAALRCLEELLTFQAVGSSIASEPLANMLSLLTDEVEKVLPVERGTAKRRPMNDAT